MIGRRWIFLFSLLLALMLHAGLFLAAPEIVLLQRQGALARPPGPVVVRLLDEMHEPARTAAVTSPLITRPGSIRDLLAIEAPYTPDSFDPVPPAAIPDLDSRLRSNIADREPEVSPPPETLRRLDARILAINAETARREVQVARRLVRRGDDRIVDDGVLPLFRDESGGGDDGHLRFDLPTVSLLAEPLEDSDALTGTSPPGAPMSEPADSAPKVEDRGVAQAERRLVQTSVAVQREALRQLSDAEAIDDLVMIELTTYRPPEERLGYFRVRIAPRPDAVIDPLPKEVLFAIDASNSITDHKLRETVRGVQAALEMLRPGDRFNIVVFRHNTVYFQDHSVLFSPEEREAARTFLTGLESQGRTDFYQALLPLVADGPAPGYPRMLFVLSDGRPTSGVTDGRTIINGITADNRLRNAVFSFGGGRTTDESMLDLLAYRNKGVSEYSADIAGIPSAFAAFFESLNDPLLVSLEADFSGLSQQDVYPRILPDFFGGRAIEVFGRFDPDVDAAFAVRLRGWAGGERREVFFRSRPAEATDGGPEIARRWAFQKAYDLIGEMALSGETPERLETIRALSRRYNLRTSYDE